MNYNWVCWFKGLAVGLIFGAIIGITGYVAYLIP